MRNRFLRFPGGKPKAVTFSYDDGEREDIRLAQIINRYGIKCTFNINSDFVAQMPGKKKLALEEIKTYLLDAGHEVAVNSLVYSADGSIVYNPTFFDVWLDVDQKLYKIKPGETLILNN